MSDDHDIIERYRRAGEGDASRPSDAVRRAIAAEARAVAGARRGRRTWQIAASMAVLGIVTWLVYQSSRTAPPGAAPAYRPEPALERALDVSDSPTKAAVAAPEAPSVAAGEAAPRATAPPLLAPAVVAAPTPQMAAGTSAPMTAADSTAKRERESTSLEEVAAPSVAQGVAPVDWDERATAAARLAYPEVFAADAPSGAVRIDLWFDGNGALIRSARSDVDADTNASSDAVAGVAAGAARALRATVPESAAASVHLPASTGQPATVDIHYRVLPR